MSKVEEKDNGGRSRVENEVKVCLSALSKHQRGRLGEWDKGSRRKENRKVITIMMVV